MFCRKCGCDGNEKYCRKCGMPFSSGDDVPAQAPASKFKNRNIIIISLAALVVVGGSIAAFGAIQQNRRVEPIALETSGQAVTESAIQAAAEVTKTAAQETAEDSAVSDDDNAAADTPATPAPARVQIEHSPQTIQAITELPRPSVKSLEDMGDSFLYRNILRGTEYINYDYQTDTIFPGAVIRGDTLFRDGYMLITANRIPLTLTCGANRIKDVNPDITSTTAAVHELVQMSAGTLTTNMSYSEHLVERGNTYNVGLNAGVGFKGAELKVGQEYSTQEFVTNMVVVFKQIYYTVNAAPPENAASFFNENVNVSAFGEYSPAYVSGVSYGRIGIMTISSKATEEEIKRALDFAVPIGATGVTVSGGIETEAKQIFNESKITVNIIGGDASASGAAVNWEGFFNYFASGANASDSLNVVPLSYTLKYLSDNSTVEVCTILDERELNSDAMLLELEFTDLRNTEYSNLSVAMAEAHFTNMDYYPIKNDVFFTEGVRVVPNRNLYIIENLRDNSELQIWLELFNNLSNNEKWWQATLGVNTQHQKTNFRHELSDAIKSGSGSFTVTPYATSMKADFNYKLSELREMQ